MECTLVQWRLSIYPWGTGSCGYLCHEIPGISILYLFIEGPASQRTRTIRRPWYRIHDNAIMHIIYCYCSFGEKKIYFNYSFIYVSLHLTKNYINISVNWAIYLIILLIHLFICTSITAVNLSIYIFNHLLHLSFFPSITSIYLSIC